MPSSITKHLSPALFNVTTLLNGYVFWLLMIHDWRIPQLLFPHDLWKLAVITTIAHAVTLTNDDAAAAVDADLGRRAF